MPWEQTSAMDQRVKFIADCLSGRYSKSELCRAYGISRPTAYKWIKRYHEVKPPASRSFPGRPIITRTRLARKSVR